MVVAADERPHEPTGEVEWTERWWFDAVVAPGRLELTVRRPSPPRPLGYRLVLTGPDWGPPGTALVLVADATVEPPRGDRLELRAPGLWADHVCEEPFRRWSVGLEAFGVALDREEDAEADDPYGVRCAVGADLEWEHVGELSVVDDGPVTGYRAPCRVSGEVLIGDRRHEIDADGQRGHRWGGAG